MMTRESDDAQSSSGWTRDRAAATERTGLRGIVRTLPAVMFKLLPSHTHTLWSFLMAHTAGHCHTRVGGMLLHRAYGAGETSPGFPLKTAYFFRNPDADAWSDL